MMLINKLRIILVVFFAAGFLLGRIGSARAQQAAIESMLTNGFSQDAADGILANWSEAKKAIVGLAKVHKNNPEKLEVLVKICQNRFAARKDAVMGAIDDAMKAGYTTPIDAMVPTGGWKKALTINAKNKPFDFVLEAANADIDETFFGKMGATEFVVERTSFRYAERALKTKLGKTPADFKRVNQVLTNGEVTWFPRDPQGRYTPQFEENFPSVVLESYRGREGQAAMEINYLINKKKGLADIIHYDEDGNIIRVIENQPAESVIEDLRTAKYTTMQRLAKVQQDYGHKYVDQVIKKGLSGDDRAEWAAKMLERMYGEESAITGRSLKNNQLFNQAAEVKKIMRTIKNPQERAAALNKVLKGQSLDDFVVRAEAEMKWMDFQNRQRAAWMLDDDLGKPVQGGRLNTVMKGIALIGHGYVVTDAYLKAHEGERVNKMAKALAASLAADLVAGKVGMAVGSGVGAGVGALAGKTAGAVAGGAAGFVSGAVAAAIAVYAVNGTWEWTEEGVHSMLEGYKGDDTVKKMFLNDKGMIAKFVGMSPQEIKDYIDREWEEHYQYGGFYAGRGTGEHADMKQYIFEQAMEHQFLLKKGKLDAQIRGDILRQELAALVEKMDSGQLSPEEFEKLKEKFGKNTANMIQDKLMNDPKYARYKKTLEELEKQGGKPGIWDRMTQRFDTRTPEEIAFAATDRYNHIFDMKEYIDGLLADFYSDVGKFDAAFQQDPETLEEGQMSYLFNDASLSFSDLEKDFNMFQTTVNLFLADLEKSSGRMKDTSDFNYKKGEASRILAELIEKFQSAKGTLARLERLMKLKQKADEMKEEDDAGDDDDDGDEGDDDGDGDGEDDGEDQDDQDEGEGGGDDEGDEDDDKQKLPKFVQNTDKDKDKTDDQGDEDGETDEGKKKKKPKFVSKITEGGDQDEEEDLSGPKDYYEIKSIAIETVEVRRNKKIYQKLKDIDSAVVIMRIRGGDHIIDGYNAVQLLIEKGYLYHVADVGYVTTEKFDNFTGEPESVKKDDFVSSEDAAKYESCRRYQECLAKYGAGFENRDPTDYKGKAYWDIVLCKPTKAQCIKESQGKGTTMDDIYGGKKKPEKGEPKEPEEPQVRPGGPGSGGGRSTSGVSKTCRDMLHECRRKFGSSFQPSSPTVPMREYQERLKCMGYDKQCGSGQGVNMPQRDNRDDPDDMFNDLRRTGY